jgi:hypothetical protein
MQVVAVRCPAEKCRKYQLVEATDRGKVVTCLICKAPIRVPADDPVANPPPPPNPPVARRLP